MVCKLTTIVATNDQFNNDLEGFGRCISLEKLKSIYSALRREVFEGKPIQQNQGNNGLFFVDLMGRPSGNYGWQLFRVPEGAAMLGDRGPVSYWAHGEPIEEETMLQELYVTFHQKGNSIAKTKDIVDRYTEKDSP